MKIKANLVLRVLIAVSLLTLILLPKVDLLALVLSLVVVEWALPLPTVLKYLGAKRSGFRSRRPQGRAGG